MRGEFLLAKAQHRDAEDTEVTQRGGNKPLPVPENEDPFGKLFVQAVFFFKFVYKHIAPLERKSQSGERG
jgi:hypothetical protein